MMKRSFGIVLSVVMFVVCGWALAADPFTLGPVFRLGSSTAAGVPTPSSTIAGGLIYISDDAGVAFNTGSEWVTLARASSSGSSSFWYDAGAGYIYAAETLLNPDGGAIIVRASQPPNHSNMTDGFILGHTTTPEGVNLSPMMSWVGETSSPPSNSRMAAIFGSQSTSGSVRAGMVLWGGPDITFQSGAIGAVPGRSATLLGTWRSTKTLHFDQASGSDAFSFATGARGHFGGGSTDYLASNGTRVFTPGDYEWTGTTGTQVYASGNGRFGYLNAGITAGTCTATEPAHLLYTGDALDTGDAVLEVSSGALRKYQFTVYKDSPTKAWYGIELGQITGGAPDGGTGADPIFRSYRATYVPDAGTIATATCQDNFVAKTGALAGDDCSYGISGAQTNDERATFQCFVEAADVVTFRLCNHSGGSITPSSTHSCRCFSSTP